MKENLRRPNGYWKKKKNLLKALNSVNSRRELELKYSSAYKEIKKDKKLSRFLDKKFPKLIVHTSSIGENTTRLFLEKLFKTKFPKILANFIINPKTGKALELDGFNEELKIAFEYGNHMQFKRNVNLKKVLAKDRYKQKICKKLGIKLLQLNIDSFRVSKDPLVHLKIQIKKEFERLNILIPAKFNTIKLKPVLANGIKWTQKEIWKEVKKHEFIYNFQRASPGAYGMAVKLDIIEVIRKYFKQKSDPHFGVQYNFKSCLKILKDSGGTMRTWLKTNHRSFTVAKNNGWLQEIKRLGLRKINRVYIDRRKWTEQKIAQIIEINQFKTLSEWKLKHFESYDAAGDRGWVHKIFIPMFFLGQRTRNRKPK